LSAEEKEKGMVFGGVGSVARLFLCVSGNKQIGRGFNFVLSLAPW